MTIIETPCIGDCTLMPAQGLCRGCRRTLDEIAQWAALTPERRRQIMDELANRQVKDSV